MAPGVQARPFHMFFNIRPLLRERVDAGWVYIRLLLLKSFLIFVQSFSRNRIDPETFCDSGIIVNLANRRILLRVPESLSVYPIWHPIHYPSEVHISVRRPKYQTFQTTTGRMTKLFD